MGKQQTFGEITVNKTRGNVTCDKQIDTGENGVPVTCDNSDILVIKHESTGLLEFYCGIHAKDDWLEMAEPTE